DVCAGIEMWRGFLDCMISSQAGIGKRGDLFWSEAGREFYDSASACLEKIRHATICIHAGKSRVGAVHISARPAGATEATGDLGMDNHRIANSNIADSRPDFVDPTGVFMTRRIWQGHAGFLAELALDNVQIGAAQAGSPDAHDDVVGGGYFWLCHLL